MQAATLKMIKRWLNLPRGFTTSALHHPNVQSLSNLRSRAKLTFFHPFSHHWNQSSRKSCQSLHKWRVLQDPIIQSSVVDLLLKARSSTTTISSKTLSNQCKSEFRKQVIEKHDKRLKELTVQNKILWVAELENSNQVWKRIMQGLAGQKSFLLRAGTDTLPTPLNLRQWRLRMDLSCPLMYQPTIHHTLSNCPEAQQQGSYTWRHDYTLQTLVKSIKVHLDSEASLYVDLPGMRANVNPASTIPEVICNLSPPWHCLGRRSQGTLTELTIPHNSLESLSNARDQKSQKEIYVSASS